jgi:signal transduction histidine kinase/ActR/RegA family two-component response regulator
MFGWTADEVLGEPFPAVMPGREEGFRQQLADSIAGRAVQGLEAMHLRKDGTSIAVTSWAVPCAQGNRHGALALVADVSDSNRLHAEREDLLRTVSAERGWLKAVLEQSPAGIIIAEAPSGRILLVSDRVPSIMRQPVPWPATAEAYRHVQAFHPEDGRRYEPHELPLARAIRQGEVINGEYIEILRGDGTRGFTRLSAAPVRDADGRIVAGIVVFLDITEQALAERRTRQLAELVAQLSASNTPAEVFTVIIEKGIQALAAYAGAVHMLDATRAHLQLAAAIGYPREVRDEYQRLPLDDSSLPCDAVRTGAPIFLQREEWEARYERKPSPASATRSLGALPLRVSGDTAGVLTLSFDTPRLFTETDRLFMGTLADHCGQALERALLYEAEQKARMGAEAANRAKDEFLAILSHELRTPLNAIMGWAQILRQRLATDDPLTLKALDALERGARTQELLVGDLLDVSRIISGKFQIEPRPMHLPPVLAAAVDAVRLSAQSKDIDIDVDIPTEMDPIFGDPARLQQVALNLLSNAVKFTPKGGRVSVRVDRSASQARLTIADTGEGIDPAVLPFVFDRFRQGDASTTRTHGGLGLGLAIVRHVVEAHGGTVAAQSDGPETGASFTVTLPIMTFSDGVAPPPAPRFRRLTDKPLAGVRVHVIEDDVDSREFVRVVLERAGAEVQTFESAAPALEALRSSRPDAVLCDIGLPEMDGYALIDRMRGLEGEFTGPRLSIAALTAYASADDRRRALIAGFDLHIAKPIDANDLVAVVASLVGKADALRPGLV